MKKLLACLLFLGTFHALSQAVPPVMREQNLESVKVDRHFNRKYKQTLRRLRRVYPLALQAKLFLIDFEEELENTSSKRQRKKLSKEAQKNLKDEFLFSIKDLYIEEGILLMKLVHRETGMTVEEIVSEFRGGFQAAIYSGMGKLWDQDLSAKYDPNGEDWITELVINDIINKRVQFDWNLETLDKTAYKLGMKDYRKRMREYKKNNRQRKREERRKKRQKDEQ